GWFVGYTPSLATAVWVGGLGEKFTITLGGRQITGGSYPARIWGEFMRAWQQGREPVAFPAPPARPGGELLVVPGGIDLTPPPAPPAPPGDEQAAPPPPATPPPPGDAGGPGPGGGGGQAPPTTTPPPSGEETEPGGTDPPPGDQTEAT